MVATAYGHEVGADPFPFGLVFHQSLTQDSDHVAKAPLGKEYLTLDTVIIQE